MCSTNRLDDTTAVAIINTETETLLRTNQKGLIMQTNLSTKRLEQLITLNSRELSVQYYTDQDLTIAEISSMLNLSPVTVRFHELNLRCKLALSTNSVMKQQPCFQS